MKSLFPFFNHSLTNEQKEHARAILGVERFIEVPEELIRLWGEVPAEKEALLSWIQPVFTWLREHGEKGDYVLIQGEFGAVYLMVRFALAKGYIPIYATTERHAMEKRMDDGSIRLEHVFRFVRFREYGK